MFSIRSDDPNSPPVAALLTEHVAFGRAHSPPENAHVLDAGGLAASAVTFFTAWDGDTLAGMAALKQFDAEHGELKSMRTASTHLRRGVARALLAHIAGEARRRGLARLSLETGTAAAFTPATALYEAFGFVDGPVFGSYPPNSHTRFMTLTL